MLSDKVQYTVDIVIAGVVQLVPDFVINFFDNITIAEATNALIRSIQFVTTLLILLTAFYRFLKSRKDYKNKEK